MALTVAVAAGCGGGSTADATQFCAEIDASKEQLTAPRLRSNQDVRIFIDLYSDIGELAPLAIEKEWDDLTSNWETAATVQPENEESVLRAKSKAYATEKSAVAVRDWLESNCGVALGPVSTIVPHRDEIVPAPTKPPPTTAPPSG